MAKMRDVGATSEAGIVFTILITFCIIKIVHFGLVALDVRPGDVGVDLFHRFVIRPAADFHADLLRDPEVSGERRETVAELVDGDTLDAGTVAGSLHRAA